MPEQFERLESLEGLIERVRAILEQNASAVS